MEISDSNEFEDEMRTLQGQIQCPPGSEMVGCAFDELADLTSHHMKNYLDSYKSSAACPYPLRKHDCVCYHQDDSAVVYSSGGTKYIVPVSIKVLKVFPLEEGLIIQCDYDPNNIRFSLSALSSEEHSFAYLTLNSHPLNDLHPLAIMSPTQPLQDLICTKYELIFASTDLPCVIAYDSTNKELVVALLRVNNEKEEYLASLDPARRHPLLPRVASMPHLILDPILRHPLSSKPNAATIISGFSRTEFVVAAHVGERQLLLIEGDASSRVPNFRHTRTCENIVSMQTLEERYNNGNEFEGMPQLCLQRYEAAKEESAIDCRSLLIGRLERMRIHLAALDGNGNIQIFRGAHVILSVDIGSSVLGTFCESEETKQLLQHLVKSRAVSLSEGKGWRVNVHTADGAVARVSLEALHLNCLVHSVLQGIQAAVDRKLFICFYSDFLEVLQGYKQKDGLGIDATTDLACLKELIIALLHKKSAVPGSFLEESPLKRRRKDLAKTSATEPSANAWTEMLKSDYHQTQGKWFDDLFGKSLGNFSFPQTPIAAPVSAPMDLKETANPRLKTDAEEFAAAFPGVIRTLHLLYEDLKLHKCHKNLVEPLADLLFQLCLCLDASYAPYVEYYVREHPHLTSSHCVLYAHYCHAKASTAAELKSPADIFAWISRKLTPAACSSTVDTMAICYERTRVVCRLFEVLAQGSAGYRVTSKVCPVEGKPTGEEMDTRSESLYPVFCGTTASKSRLPKPNLDDYYLVSTHKGSKMEKVLVVLLEEGITSEEIESDWPWALALPIYSVIWHAREHPLSIQTYKWGERMYQLIGREDIAFNLRLGSQIPREQFSRNYHRGYYSQFSPPKRGKLSTGVGVEKGGQKASQQQRISDYFAGIEMYKELIGYEIGKREGEGMMGTGRRTTGAVSASGIMNIAEYRFNEDVRYKEVTLLLDSARIIKLRLHNIKEEDRVSDEKFELAKQALLYKMATRQLSKCVGRGSLTYGTLLTLPTETLESLVGRIPPKDAKLMLDLKDEAKEKELINWPEFHNGVAAGLRLAKESSAKGANTRNWIMYQKPRTPKFEHGGLLLAMGLLGYLDCLLSTDIYQYLKAAHEATTIGILIGSAASKMGSMDDSLSRTLCLHIPFLLPPSFEIEISMPIQSAAILGAGLLYFGTCHRLMTEMILSQIGRKPLSDKCMDREVYALCAGFALGIVNINYKDKAIGLSDLQLDERLIRLIEGGKVMDPPLSMLSANMNAESSKCSSVLEGENVNIHITAPGAIMALAIIHMQTDNETVARRLEIPCTFYALEHAKPFHILLKIVARNLIMWNQIECSTEWLYRQVPPLVKDIFESSVKAVQTKYGGTLIAEEEIDYSAIALCYISIVAGAALALGLRYAGSNNKAAMAVVCREIEKLRVMPTTTLKDQNYTSYNDKNKNKVDKYSLDNCLCVCAFAISIVLRPSINL